ncbi:hypothetical protein LXL04_031308 [Taraxacum kok-saghyz]
MTGGMPHSSPTDYRTLVGALQYLSLTRPDISFTVNRLSQFMHAPTSIHWTALKWLLRYLHGTMHHGILSKRKSPLTLHAFTDADWAVQWLTSLLSELGFSSSTTPTIYCDNLSATSYSKNPVFHSRMKHLALDFHFVREKDHQGTLRVQHINSDDQLADALTKPLLKPRCKDNFLNIGCNDDDLKSDNEEDNDSEEENGKEFGSEEEIDDGQASNITDLGNEAGKHFPIHDPSVKWSKMKPILGERYESAHQVNPEAYQHLMERDPKTWSKAFFRTDVACEAVENGIAECFNAIFLEARKKPLLAMLEEIRFYNMAQKALKWETAVCPAATKKMLKFGEDIRFYNMAQKALKWETAVCPAATKKMLKFGEDIRNWYVNPSGPSVFEARNGYEAYVVDLQQHNCLQRGHNKVSCKNPTVIPEPQPKKRMGRPIVEPDIYHWTRGGGRGGRGRRGSRGGGISGTGGGTGGGTSGGTGGGIGGGTSGGTGGAGNGQGIEPQDLKQLYIEVKYLVMSGYTNDEIKTCMGLTQEELDQVLNYQNNIDEEIIPMEDQVKEAATGLESQDATGLESQDADEVGPQVEVAMDLNNQADEVGPQVEHQVRAVPRTRKPSQRIINRKLAKKMGGVGSSAANSLDLD